MQSRRDQLQAYRFLVRRAVGAVVTGEPDVAESPMRRLTVTTMSGIMVAILVVVGFGLVGIIRPGPSDKWKHEGAIVVDPEGTRFVYLDGQLWPTLNYASAVLATIAASGSTSSAATPASAVSVAQVSTKSIEGIPRGRSIGIPDLPQSMPANAAGLVTGPWSVCSVLGADAGRPRLVVSVDVGRAPAGAAVEPDSAVYVQTRTGQNQFLLWHGQKLPVSPQGAQAAGLDGATPVYVGSAFLAGIPSADYGFQALTLPGSGKPTGKTVDGMAVNVGDLVEVGTGSSAAYYVGVSNGFTVVTGFIAKLLALSPRHRTLHTTVAPPATGGALQLGLPSQPPPLTAGAADATTVCGIYNPAASSATAWNFTTATSTNGLPPSGEPMESTTGLADDVEVPSDAAAVVVSQAQPPPTDSGQDARTRFIIASTARQHAVVDYPDVLKAFGYDSVPPVVLAASILQIIPVGPAMDASVLHR